MSPETPNLPHRDPETGQFTSGSHDGVTASSGINRARWAEDSADPADFDSVDTIDINLPDRHVMAIWGVRATLSDVYDQQEGQLEHWVYHDAEAPGTNDWNARTSPDSHFWHTNIGAFRNATDTSVGVGPYRDETWFKLPILSASGKLERETEGSSAWAGDGEWILDVFYDIVPAKTDQDYLELLQKR